MCVFSKFSVVALLILGTANPPGEGDDYNGLYLKAEELRQVVESKAMHGIPVKTEHSGQDIGHVVSTFLDDTGALQCVMKVDESTLCGTLATGFVRDRVAHDLSLGYKVDVQQTGSNKLTAKDKRVLEVSLVRKGARDGCHIHAYQDGNSDKVVMMSRKNTWEFFNLEP